MTFDCNVTALDAAQRVERGEENIVTPNDASARESLDPPSEAARAIGLDVGGTKIAAAVVTSDGQVVERTQCATPAAISQDTLTVIERKIDGLRARHPEVQGIGIGFAGLVEWPEGRVRFAPNIAFRNLPLRQHIARHTGLPVIVDNDANTAAWAEARFGAGAGKSDILLLTVGTGIGGGLVLGGHIYRGSSGLGAEVGHTILSPRSGARCTCGNIGCFEAMASGTALGRLGRDAAENYPKSLLLELAGTPQAVTGELVYQAARQGDRIALSLFEEVGFWLGVGIASLVNIFDPEVVVLAGGLPAVGDLLLKPAAASLAEYLFAQEYRKLPPLVPTTLGLNAGLIGAGAMIISRLKA